MDVPFLERAERVLVGQADYQLSPDHSFQLRHQMIRMRGGEPDQRQITYGFLPQVSANKQVTYQVSLSGAQADVDSTELTWNWVRDDRTATVWLRRAAYDYNYGAVGRTAPEDSTVGAHTARSWYLASRVGRGLPGDRFGHVELEAGFDLTDRGVAGLKHNRLELILRYDRDLTRNTGLIADLRYARYHLEGQADGSDGTTTDTDYFNPFVGFRYAPIRKVELVAGYGIDPVDYSIDYGGRQLGRWMYRQNYLFDHPGATNLETENFLKKARVVTLRAQLQF
jgi:hypothetical protein